MVLIGIIASGGGDPASLTGATASPAASSTATGPTAATTEDEPTEEPAEEPRASKGETVGSGGLQFTVSKVNCGVTRIVDEYLNTEPQGQFCLVTLRAKNISDEPQRFYTTQRAANSPLTVRQIST